MCKGIALRIEYDITQSVMTGDHKLYLVIIFKAQKV